MTELAHRDERCCKRVLLSPVGDMQGLRGLPNWEYDARVRTALDIATAKLKLIESEMDKGSTHVNDADLRAMFEVMRAKIRDTEGWLGPMAH
jgi:hypothetical protein